MGFVDNDEVEQIWRWRIVDKVCGTHRRGDSDDNVCSLVARPASGAADGLKYLRADEIVRGSEGPDSA